LFHAGNGLLANAHFGGEGLLLDPAQFADPADLSSYVRV